MSPPSKGLHVAALDPPPRGLGPALEALGLRGHRISRCEHPEQVLALLEGTPPPDLLLLRATGRSRPALELISRVRGSSQIPVVLLGGAVDGSPERVSALELGADDYLAHNIPVAEAVARVQAVLRRAAWAANRAAAPRAAPPVPARAIEGGWHLAPHRRSVVAAGSGEAVPLTGAEYELLRLLTVAHGEPVDREAISRAVFRRPWRVEDRAVDGLVKRIRRKLRADAIATVRGVGYALRFADAIPNPLLHREVENCVPDTTERAA